MVLPSDRPAQEFSRISANNDHTQNEREMTIVSDHPLHSTV